MPDSKFIEGLHPALFELALRRGSGLRMSSLRQQKEAFVAGHEGTTLTEVSIIASAPVILLLLWRLLWHPAATSNGLFHAARPTIAGLAFEFAVLVLPQVAHLLSLASPAAVVGGSAALAVALCATQHVGEWQQRWRFARRRPLLDALV